MTLLLNIFRDCMLVFIRYENIYQIIFLCHLFILSRQVSNMSISEFC